MCEHLNFVSDVNVQRVTSDKEPTIFIADITMRCVNCREEFVFLGLPEGRSLQGAAVSADGTEGRFAFAVR